MPYKPISNLKKRWLYGCFVLITLSWETETLYFPACLPNKFQESTWEIKCSCCYLVYIGFGCLSGQLFGKLCGTMFHANRQNGTKAGQTKHQPSIKLIGGQIIIAITVQSYLTATTNVTWSASINVRVILELCTILETVVPAHIFDCLLTNWQTFICTNQHKSDHWCSSIKVLIVYANL